MTKYKILVVEDDSKRINTFIEYLGGNKLKIVDTVDWAIIELEVAKYDYIFLTGEVGYFKESCVEVVEYILDDLSYQPFVILHIIDILTVDKINNLLPEASWKPFGSDEFYFLT